MEKDDYIKNLGEAILQESTFRKKSDKVLTEKLTPAEEQLKDELEASKRMGKLTDAGQSKLDQLKSKEWR